MSAEWLEKALDGASEKLKTFTADYIKEAAEADEPELFPAPTESQLRKAAEIEKLDHAPDYRDISGWGLFAVAFATFLFPEFLRKIPDGKKSVYLALVAIDSAEHPFMPMSECQSLAEQEAMVRKFPWMLADIDKGDWTDSLVITAIKASGEPLSFIDIDSEPLYIQKLIVDKFPGRFPVNEGVVKIAKGMLGRRSEVEMMVPRRFHKRCGMREM